jgi:hypothetical protein
MERCFFGSPFTLFKQYLLKSKDLTQINSRLISNAVFTSGQALVVVGVVVVLDAVGSCRS